MAGSLAQRSMPCVLASSIRSTWQRPPNLSSFTGDVFTYAMVSLRTDTHEDIGAALRGFAKRMEEIALLSGRTTATGS